MHLSLSLPATPLVCSASTHLPVQRRVGGTDAWFSEAA